MQSLVESSAVRRVPRQPANTTVRCRSPAAIAYAQAAPGVNTNINDTAQNATTADQWEEGFRRLVHHVERHGDTRVPASFPVDGYPPGSWVDRPHL